MAGTTTNNAWTYPTSTDLVKDGASAIQTLATGIDTSTGKGLIAWQTYAPTLSSGWANGNGVWSVARYCQIGKTVHVQATFTLGTTTTKGTTCIVSLPVTAQGTGSAQIGNGWATITATQWILALYPSTTTAAQLTIILTNGTHANLTGITATTPATWATGNVISFALTYEAA
jgi:hypothetical protein